MAIIGITGLPGTGKSYLSKYLSKLGSYYLLDADKIGHSLLKEKEVINFVKKHYPDAIENENIIRSKLANIIFKNKRVYQFYNDFISKKMKQYIVEKIFNKMHNYKNMILDATLIFEWELNSLFDIIVYCKADKKKRFERIASRGNNIEDYKRRENVLLDENIKIEKSDIVIENNYDEKIYESIKKIEKYISEIE